MQFLEVLRLPCSHIMKSALLVLHLPPLFMASVWEKKGARNIRDLSAARARWKSHAAPLHEDACGDFNVQHCCAQETNLQ